MVLDGAVIGRQAFVGAGSLITSNTEIPARHLAHGSPARVVRELTRAELAWKADGTATYHWLTHVSADHLTETEPLREEEPTRPALLRPPGGAKTLHEARAGTEPGSAPTTKSR
ncbi:hypothetical protein [Pseudarthrobacter phenanthrenivorans]|uniref:hypothetical protein n=1 Tax=Pseudarthrobacter phenanthrenivorans TaxID=361575 RepID=UPI0034E8C50B